MTLAIADPIDVFSENGTTMYRYNTLLNICDLGDSDSNISDVGIVHVKLGASQEYDLQTVRSSILNSVVGKSTIPESITVKDSNTANIKYNAYSVATGEVLLTTKNRLQFNLKLTETQASSGGAYSNVLAFTVYKYSGTWHVSENCVHYTGSTFTEIE